MHYLWARSQSLALSSSIFLMIRLEMYQQRASISHIITHIRCYDRDNRLRSKTLSIVREVGSGLYLNKQNASDEVLSVLE